MKTVCSALAILAFSTALLAQDAPYLEQPPLLIKRLSGEITFDGHSDEAAWADALSVPFITYRPVWGQPPTEKTELLIGHDDEHLYLAGRCYTKDSSTIVARTLVRDGWRGDDWMTFHIDSRFDRQNALVFSIYPLGSRYDAAVSNDAVPLGSATFNESFNMIWDARCAITAEGWFFEVKIPLYNLRFKADAGGDIPLGISSTRIIQHNQEYHQFPAIPQNVIDPISKPSFKQPALLSGVPQPRLFWLTPYTLLSRNRSYLPPKVTGQSYERQVANNAQLGLDAKIGLSPYLTLDVSVNPDFAQVEADDQLVNLSRFSLFFPEKRLFFQEAAGLFEFGLGGSSQLFYSRQIGIQQGELTSIYGGLRLTGKLDADTDIGLLNMQSAPVRLADSSVLPAENFGVLRMRRKMWNDRSFLGLMMTSRASELGQNYAFGLDALVNPGGVHYLFLAGASTLDRQSEGPTEAGLGASRLSALWETRSTDDWHHQLGYTYSGQGFQPAAGFVDRSGFHNFRGSLSYGRFAKDQSERFQYKRFTLLDSEAYLSENGNDWETITLASRLNLRTFWGADWSATLTYNYEFLADPLDFGSGLLIEPGLYRYPSFSIGYFQARNRNIRWAGQLTEGQFFDGRRFSFSFNPIFSFGKHWEVQASYGLTYLRFPEKALYPAIHLARFQVNYALNLHLSATLITQYNSTAKQVFNNLRLRYNFKDGHDLFLVWNENFLAQPRGFQDLLRPVSGQQAFILKYSYTFDRLLG